MLNQTKPTLVRAGAAALLLLAVLALAGGPEAKEAVGAGASGGTTNSPGAPQSYCVITDAGTDGSHS